MTEEQLNFIMQYENLVYKVISKYHGYLDHEDLYQVGMIGLMKAVSHVDLNRMDTFIPYATYYIQGEVNQFLRENKVIKLSKDTVSLQRKYDMVKERLTQQFGRNPSREELAFVLEEDISKIQEIERSKIETLSLDYQQETDSSPLYNYIQQEEMAYRPEFMDLHQAIEELPSPDREIIIAQFFQDKTQNEIAECFGMSQVQVHRKKEQGLQKIKQKVA